MYILYLYICILYNIYTYIGIQKMDIYQFLFVKLTSQTILTTSVSIIQYLRKQLLRNDIATTKVRLIMKIVKTVPRIVEIYLAIKRK